MEINGIMVVGTTILDSIFHNKNNNNNIIIIHILVVFVGFRCYFGVILNKKGVQIFTKTKLSNMIL
jgi:hypothetical protein